MLSGGRAGTLRDLSGCHRLSGWLESLIPGSHGQGSGHIRVALQGPLGPKGAAGSRQWTRHPLPAGSDPDPSPVWSK